MKHIKIFKNEGEIRMGKIKNLQKIMAILVAGTLVLTGCSSKASTSSKAKGKIEIGISQFAEFSALDDNRKGFIKALEDNGYKEGSSLKIDYQNAQGDFNVSQTIAKQFSSQNKDLIFAIATPSAQGAYNSTKKIPILMSAVTDPKAAGLVKSLDKPETNVSGTSDAIPVEKHLSLIKLFAPKAKRIGVLYSTSEVNSEIQVNELKEYSKNNGYEVVPVGVSGTNEVGQAVTSMLDKIDVLFVPTDNLVVSSMPIIVQATLAKKIPIIASESGSVEQGALATQGIDYYKLGYKTGEMAVKVLKGKNISAMPVATADETSIIVNEDTLKALGLSKPDDKNIQYVKNR